MNLKNYLKDNKIESIGPSPESAKAKLTKAFKFLRNIKKMAGVVDNEIIYPSAHDASRLACEAILFWNGYRVKKNIEASHYIIIDCAKELAGTELNYEFIRFQKMRKTRNKLEYGDLDTISQGDLEQALKDLEKLLNYTRDLMDKENNKYKLI